MNWLRRIANLLFSGTSPQYSVTYSEQHPIEKHLRTGIIHVVSFSGTHKWAYLRCPCPQHDVIRLNLSKEKRPRWAIKVNENGRPDILPSIWQLDGCFSHFWIRDGQVKWAHGSGKPPVKDYLDQDW